MMMNVAFVSTILTLQQPNDFMLELQLV